MTVEQQETIIDDGKVSTNDLIINVENNNDLISVGKYVIISMLSGQKKIVRLEDGDMSISVARLGKFSLAGILGKPYGLTFEVLEDGHKLRILTREELNRDHRMCLSIQYNDDVHMLIRSDRACGN